MHSTVSQSCTQEGAVEIIGTMTPTLIAGRLEICVAGTWRAVYDDAWGTLDVKLLCNEKGFPSRGIYINTCSEEDHIFSTTHTGAKFCTKSCFGSSQLSYGMTRFICENATTFQDCERTPVDHQAQHHNAGIICSNLFLVQQNLV